MAQIDKELYKVIADAYALIDVALSGVSANARTALDAIVDVNTTTYTGKSPSAVDADAALEIELALLSVFNAAYGSANSIAASSIGLLSAVRAVNNHVVNNTAGTGTSTAKMDAWINVSMGSTWTAECPSGWANLCDDAGYDVTNWTTS